MLESRSTVGGNEVEGSKSVELEVRRFSFDHFCARGKERKVSSRVRSLLEDSRKQRTNQHDSERPDVDLGTVGLLLDDCQCSEKGAE